MTAPLPDTLRSRLANYARQLRTAGAIRAAAVEVAFAAIPRHVFVRGFYDRGRPG